MNQTELMIALGAALFAAFLLGWLAGWLTHRAGGAAPAPGPDNDAVGRLAAAETAAAQAREELRDFFEVDANHIAAAAMVDLFREGAIDEATLRDALSRYDIDGGKPNPRLV